MDQMISRQRERFHTQIRRQSKSKNIQMQRISNLSTVTKHHLSELLFEFPNSIKTLLLWLSSADKRSQTCCFLFNHIPNIYSTVEIKDRELFQQWTEVLTIMLGYNCEMQQDFMQKGWERFVQTAVSLSDYNSIFRILENMNHSLLKYNHILFISTLSKQLIKIKTQPVLSFLIRVLQSKNQGDNNLFLLSQLFDKQLIKILFSFLNYQKKSHLKIIIHLFIQLVSQEKSQQLFEMFMQSLKDLNALTTLKNLISQVGSMEKQKIWKFLTNLIYACDEFVQEITKLEFLQVAEQNIISNQQPAIIKNQISFYLLYISLIETAEQIQKFHLLGRSSAVLIILDRGLKLTEFEHRIIVDFLLKLTDYSWNTFSRNTKNSCIQFLRRHEIQTFLNDVSKYCNNKETSSSADLIMQHLASYDAV